MTPFWKGCVILNALAGEWPHTSRTSCKPLHGNSNLSTVWHSTVSAAAWCLQGKLYIVTEYAANGNLHEYIKQHGGQRFSESMIWKLFCQILLGLNHMHRWDGALTACEWMKEIMCLDELSMCICGEKYALCEPCSSSRYAGGNKQLGLSVFCIGIITYFSRE